MKSLKMKGHSVDEAVESALKVLGAKKDEVEVKILTEGEPAVLGVFGGKMAEVEVRVKAEPSERAKTVIQDLLDKMGFLALVDLVASNPDEVVLNIRGEDLGRIIGKEGSTLNALQYLLTVMMSKEHERRIRVILDAAGYRDKREKTLRKMAQDAAQEASRDKREVSLPPLSGSERRIIHLEIQNRIDVGSFSRGEGGLRRVVIAPKELITGEDKPE